MREVTRHNIIVRRDSFTQRIKDLMVRYMRQQLSSAEMIAELVEQVRAKLRTRIRRLLAKFDYPPDEEREAVDLVIKQMETFANEWAPEAP